MSSKSLSHKTTSLSSLSLSLPLSLPLVLSPFDAAGSTSYLGFFSRQGFLIVLTEEGFPVVLGEEEGFFVVLAKEVSWLF